MISRSYTLLSVISTSTTIWTTVMNLYSFSSSDSAALYLSDEDTCSLPVASNILPESSELDETLKVLVKESEQLKSPLIQSPLLNHLPGFSIQLVQLLQYV